MSTREKRVLRYAELVMSCAQKEELDDPVDPRIIEEMEGIKVALGMSHKDILDAARTKLTFRDNGSVH